MPLSASSHAEIQAMRERPSSPLPSQRIGDAVVEDTLHIERRFADGVYKISAPDMPPEAGVLTRDRASIPTTQPKLPAIPKAVATAMTALVTFAAKRESLIYLEEKLAATDRGRLLANTELPPSYRACIAEYGRWARRNRRHAIGHRYRVLHRRVARRWCARWSFSSSWMRRSRGRSKTEPNGREAGRTRSAAIAQQCDHAHPSPTRT